MFEPAVILLLMILLYLSLRARERQKLVAGIANFKYEMTELGVRFKIDDVYEDNFKINWCDGWEIDRCFSMSGPAIQTFEHAGQNRLSFAKRVSVKVVPTLDWFTSSKIGHAHVINDVVGQIYLTLPHQIARNLLNDLRRDPNRVAELGLKKMTSTTGKEQWGVYDFELSEDLD